MPLRTAGRTRGRVRRKTHPLTEARRKAGKTVAALSRKSRIPYMTIWRIERGDWNPRPETMARLWKALGVPPPAGPAPVSPPAKTGLLTQKH